MDTLVTAAVAVAMVTDENPGEHATLGSTSAAAAVGEGVAPAVDVMDVEKENDGGNPAGCDLEAGAQEHSTFLRAAEERRHDSEKR